jgi:hypothetical protein
MSHFEEYFTLFLPIFEDVALFVDNSIGLTNGLDITCWLAHSFSDFFPGDS